MLARPIHPPIVAAASVLAAYGSTHVGLNELWRPLLVIVVASVLLLVFGGLSTRRWDAAAFATTLAVLAVMGVWQVLAAASLAWALIRWRHRQTGHDRRVSPALTRPINAIAIVWLLIATGSVALAAIPPTVERTTAGTFFLTPDAPNIYLILLDGYPRADSLRDYFDYDSEPFLSELERRGFDVSEESRSYYPITLWAVPTMLHASTVEDLGLVPWVGDNNQRRRIRALVNSSPFIASLKDSGYTTFSLVAPAAALDLRNADHVWESSWLSAFELHLVENGALNLVASEMLYEQHRAGVRGAFSELRRIAGVSAQPRFVYAHILSPHAPYAFAADGSAVEPIECEPWCGIGATYLPDLGMTLEEISGRFVGQIEFVNEQVLDTLDQIIASDPTAAIVLLSDHGSRFDRDDFDEWTRNLFAARTPGHPEAFGDGPIPVWLFPTLFDAYFFTE